MTADPPQVVYTDLDGTMVGPRGCLFRAEDGATTLAPARALLRLLDAGVTLVLVSGRTAPQLTEAARLLGADGFIGEMGAVLGWDAGREVRVLPGEIPDRLLAGAATPYEAILRTGVVDLLLQRHAGRLELHSPWHAGHQADVLLRGLVDPPSVEAELAAAGLGWLRLHDNGTLPVGAGAVLPGTTLDLTPTAGLDTGLDTALDTAAAPLHVYHLMAAGLDKGAGIAADLARRGLRRDQAVAVGDSASDLAMAGHVRRLWLTANGARDATVARRAARMPTVTVTSGSMGAGWAEAVLSAVDAPTPSPQVPETPGRPAASARNDGAGAAQLQHHLGAAGR